MKVSFDVHGANELELIEAAYRMLESFSEQGHWSLDIHAYPETVTQNGETKLWRGEVEANHEDPVP